MKLPHPARPSARVALGMLCAVGALTLAVTTIASAQAGTASELEAAKQELASINAEVDAQVQRLAELRSEADALAASTSAAEISLAGAEDRLASTEADIAETESQYAKLVGKLEERAAAMFMNSSSSFDVFLDATSVTDLSDRLQFFGVVASHDVELAHEVDNLRVELERVRAERQKAVEERAAAYEELQSQLQSLQDRFTEEQNLLDDIAQKRHEAETIVSNLREKYQQELAAEVPPPPPPSGGGDSGAPVSLGSNPFSVCPVGDPHALTDSFGAPRYGGGFHVHAGNDIMAPEGVPIYAPFPGTASDVSNSLGGLSVKVTGAQGWTYNAHMVRIGTLGSVQTGDVIGYVGATGDTSTPHNHFEWHPNVLPSSWPSSPYGYSIVGDAVNPYPLLVGVC